MPYPISMRSHTPLLVRYAVAVVCVMLVLAGVYMLLMDRVEGNPRNFWQAL